MDLKYGYENFGDKYLKGLTILITRFLQFDLSHSSVNTHWEVAEFCCSFNFFTQMIIIIQILNKLKTALKILNNYM